MANRPLYLAAYDIADDGRLARALRVLRNYATGGQKSVFECFLSDAERRLLLSEVRDVIDLDEDRFFLLRLDPRSRTRVLGVAVRPADPDFFYIG